MAPSILPAAFPALGRAAPCSAASAATAGQAPARRHGTGREGVSSGLQSPLAAPEGSARTGKGGGNTAATATEAVRCPGGHRGATPRRGGGRGRGATRGGRRGGADDAGEARLHAQERRLKPPRKGVASPFLCRRGGDGTGPTLLPPPPPAALAARPAPQRAPALPHLRAAPTAGSRPFPGPRWTARERRHRGGRCRP